MASLQDSNALLTFKVGPVYCCASTAPVEAIMLPPALTQPPGSSDAHPGIFRHAGHIVSVVDLRQRFGVDAADWQQPGRLVISRLQAGYVGFLVDSILDVLSMPTRGWGNLPPHLPREVFSRTLLLDEHIHLYADFDKLNGLYPSGLLRHYIQQLRKDADDTHPATTSTTPASTTTPEPAPGRQVTDSGEPPARSDASNEPSAPGPQRHPAASPSPAIKISASPSPATARPRSDSGRTPAAQTAARPTARAVAVAATSTPSMANPGIKPAAHHKPLSASKPPPTQHAQRATDDKPAGAEPATPPPRVGFGSTSGTSAGAARGSEPQPVPPATSLQESDDKAGLMALGLILLLVLLAGAGMYYYLMPSGPAGPALPGQLPLASAPAAEPLPPDFTAVPPATPPPELAPGPEPWPAASGSQAQAVDEPASTTPEQPAQPDPPASPTAPQPEPIPDTALAADAPHYQARIEREADGITIVVEEPDSPATAPGPASVERQQTSTELTETGANDHRPAERPATGPGERRREEIVHIVVPGDTLWHIAQRYVANPWRYPELARLSNIDNPDLIYPGDRVRIIIYRQAR